jgi:hypothetical protein
VRRYSSPQRASATDPAAARPAAIEPAAIEPDALRPGLGRRAVLRAIGLGSAAVALPALTTACSSGGSVSIVFEETNYNIAFASYLMAMIPTLIGYIFAPRWVISGIMRGAIK